MNDVIESYKAILNIVMNEVNKLYELLRLARISGNPIDLDTATIALMLVYNGWLAQPALDEARESIYIDEGV